MKRGSPLRRVPTQARSQARLERMMDAAEHELAEVGYEAATMQAIAARAETSIGSLYQFFPNKQVLFDAISDRYLTRVRGMLDLLLSEELMARPWTEVLETAVDAIWAFDRDDPAVRAIWIQGRVTPELIHAGSAINREMATRLEAFLAQHLPALPSAHRPVVATMVVETISSMIFVATLRGEPAASQVMEETKVLLRRYLEGYERPFRSEATKSPAKVRPKAPSKHRGR
ncbi:MAG: TetR family transcriptional regulator [Deltaproteobacteria bacterium]|nr:TetR family transcriptional regulator [Deltaproteobacteria bacterium]